MAAEKKPKKGGLIGVFKDIVYGMSSHEMTMGDLLGIPILPPYYSLRLLPYVTPQISGWKRRMLRERDVTDVLG
jgi:hypothetical protein